MDDRRDNAGAGVLVVDPHPMSRRGACRMIERTPGLLLKGAAGSQAEALSLLGDNGRILVALILVEPLTSAHDQQGLIAALARAAPAARIVALSARTERNFVRRVLDAGVSGFVSKNVPLELIREALARVLAGECVVTGVRNGHHR